jgi:hypothetical protein
MGGSSGGGSQVVNQGGLIDSPLNNYLIPQAQNMLGYAGQYSTLGSGFNLAPNQLMGQTYVPGPNQTIFGNPYNTSAQSANYWGAPAQPNAQGLQQMYQQFLHPQGQGGQQQGGAQQDPTQQLVGKLQSLQQSQQGGQQQQNQPQQQQVATATPPAQPVGDKTSPAENWVANNGAV